MGERQRDAVPGARSLRHDESKYTNKDQLLSKKFDTTIGNGVDGMDGNGSRPTERPEENINNTEIKGSIRKRKGSQLSTNIICKQYCHHHLSFLFFPSFLPSTLSLSSFVPPILP